MYTYVQIILLQTDSDPSKVKPFFSQFHPILSLDWWGNYKMTPLH